MPAWYTYMLRCGDGSRYVGISNDVMGRVKKHATGKGAKYTRSHLPVELVWKEKAKNETAARKREAEIKSWKRVQKLLLLNR